MEFFSYFDLHLIYLLIFTFALAFGAGSTLLSTILSLSAVRDEKITSSECEIIMHSHVVTFVSFILYAFSGIGLFTLSYEAMIGLGIFWASQTIVLILFVNAMIFQFIFLPHLHSYVHSKTKWSDDHTSRTLGIIVMSEVIALVSWVYLTIHHVLYSVPMDYFLFLACYFLTIVLCLCAYLLIANQSALHPKTRFVKNTTAILLVMSFMFFSLGLYNEFKTPIINTESEPELNVDSTASDLPVYTPAHVALHNNVEDCWVIIDQNVYDASNAVSLYPDIYTCGADVTKNYRTVIQEGVSERMQKMQVGAIGYAREEVAMHNTKKDCWLIIDTYVFDATNESMLHPAAFNCGTDATVNYHKNHGDTISDKMMQYRIGIVNEGADAVLIEDKGIQEGVLEPYRELYVDEGSWNPHDLMIIVEKDVEKLLIINGKNHELVGRIHNIGYQPHTSVYTPDARYMFLIARNGWLTKVDLMTLEPVATIKVGINSRGTALTDDGQYLVVGNYEPGNAVVIDPAKMEILKTIPTRGTLNGKEIESRVGAVVEDGDKVILALKDLNSVWVIDTSQSDFPVSHVFENIGDNIAPLHDAFLTPDGKYYIVASMGSDTVWVLDTDTWKKVTEVPTGKTPHTGPGAAWGENIFVPALGEGLITVINTTTWQPVAQIETAGPGLFVRSFSEDPTYPFVWAETAFGEHQDEIYVIDARTNTITETLIPVRGESSWHPEFTNDGAFVYVVSQGGDKVVVYDANNFSIVAEIDSETPSAVSNVGNRIEERGL